MRSTVKAIGSAATAARRAIGRGGRPPQPASEASTPAEPEVKEPAAAPAAKKAPAKKAPAKKAAEKAPAAAKTPAKKAAAKKAPAAARTPAKKASTATEAPAAAKKAPAKKAPVNKAAAKKAPAKKAPVKKAAATQATAAQRTAGPVSTTALLGSLAVKPGEEAWTAAELQEVIDELHTAREHSLELLGEAQHGLDGLMRDAGDGAGQDQADMGATTFERDHELTVVNSERDKLAQLDRALARIDDGTYGVCEACHEPIGKGRAMAFPRATLCMSCKQREERR